MKIYSQENLLNSLSLLKGTEITFLLGAGCSISSGCMAASKLIDEFRKRIYCSEHGLRYDDNTLINDVNFKKILLQEDKELNCNLYSYYFEKCFPSVYERNIFIKEKFESIKPSYGYLCFANYLISNRIHYLFTTNFDRLCEKAIRRLDENYDLSITTDSITPNIPTRLNLVKLHGDYIYDDLRNTEQELESLSRKLKQDFIKIHTHKIVVIGYSGQDKSVMNVLFDYLSANPETEIQWCLVERPAVVNDNIERLFSFNDNSGYCIIDGFDELFIKFYNIYGTKNILLDDTYSRVLNDSFVLKAHNQPESLLFNCFPIENDPEIYQIQANLTTNEISKINFLYKEVFLVNYKDYIYALGDKNKIAEILVARNSNILTVNLCAQQIPVHLKCKLLKEIIKGSLTKQGFEIYKDNIFVENNDKIKEGLKITADIFDGRLCVFVSVNYFVVLEGACLSDNLKFQINQKKSDLYASRNFAKRKYLLSRIFPREGLFQFENTKLIISQIPLGTVKTCLPFSEYNCADEPSMIVEKQTSVNQIKLLTEHGPKLTQFSPDCIRVGIFCAEEDKETLKFYLEKVLNGTDQKGSDIIPQYKGFYETFNKKIEFLYDVLPHFSATKLTNKAGFDFNKFAEFCLRGIKKMYDEKQIDIALIYIGNNFKKFKNKENLDLHDFIKLQCVNKFKTQFLEEKTLYSSDNINKKILNLAIGIFTKTIGMPWYPAKYSHDTLFLGISFGVDSKGVIVGCSQMFDGAGRGMQLIISPITDKFKKNQYLSKEEAYELGVKIRQTYYRTSKIDELKRIVIHRGDPFRHDEIEGFKMAFEGIDDFDLIQIIDKTSFNAYKFVNDKCFGYPVKRGTTIKASKDVAYIWTDGCIQDVDVLQGKNYRNSKRGMGSPIKIKKFYGKITIDEVVDDLMYLTKMDFNSSDVIYSKLPVTIKYARMVCHLLKQGNLNDDLISFEYVM